MPPTLELEVAQKELVEHDLPNRRLVPIHRDKFVGVPGCWGFDLVSLSFEAATVIIIFHKERSRVVVDVSGRSLMTVKRRVLDLDDGFVTETSRREKLILSFLVLFRVINLFLRIDCKMSLLKICIAIVRAAIDILLRFRFLLKVKLELLLEFNGVV